MRKIIVWLLAALAFAVIADYYGYISLPWSDQGASEVLETRDRLLNKTEETLQETEQ